MLVKAFKEFGMSVFDMTETKFLSGETHVFTFGHPPVCIEILTNLKGVEFSEAYPVTQIFSEGSFNATFLHINNLVQAKIASGRYRDLDDIEKLRKI